MQGLCPLQNLAQEVGQHQFDTAPSDLQPQEISPLRPQPHWHRRLANLAAHRFAFDQQTVSL